ATERFSYESQIMSERARAQLLERVPPVYQLDQAPYERFEQAFHALLADLALIERDRAAEGKSAPALKPAAFEEACQSFNSRGPYRATPGDIAAFHAYGDLTVRANVADRSLALLRELYQEGIQENSRLNAQDGIMLLQLRRPGGE